MDRMRAVPLGLAAEGFADGGLPVVPIQTFIFKVASRCNLNCTYCYVYNKGDLSYLGQPKVMSTFVVDAAITAIREYCSGRGIKQVQVIFHGGEPLLAGKSFFRSFVARANQELLPDIRPVFSMQTNGTLLDQEWLDLLRDLDIEFGISLDGPERVNDANRVDHRGIGSYNRVRRAIDLILADTGVDSLFGGLLTVIHLDADPIEVYRHYREIGIRSVDFLLPDGHYDNPPPHLSPGGMDTHYADWLIRLFDAWFLDDDPTFRIRTFENILDLIFGAGPVSSTDAIGGGRSGIIVIESDGSIEPVDVLKICGDGFTKTGFNVLTSHIEDVYRSHLVRMYQAGRSALCDKCRKCPIESVCGGGYLPHRYSSDSGFDNPSIYCRDLTKLIYHIREKAVEVLPEALQRKLNISPSISADLQQLDNSLLPVRQ